MLGQEVENEVEINDEESLDEISEEEEEEFRFDWMHLAEMGPNVHIERDTNLGTRDLDRNYNWINDAQQQYSADNLAEACDFVHQASHNSRNDDIEDEDENMHQNLNEKQKIIFDRIEKHYNDTISGLQVDALRILIMGTVGTGKSYLIKAIRG